jgi:phosphatidate cytidylyltransferase
LKTLAQRVITTVIALPVLLGFVWLGNPWLLIPATVFVLVALWEFDLLTRGMGARIAVVIPAAAAVLLLVDTQFGFSYQGHILGGVALLLLAWQTLRALVTRAVYPTDPARGAPAALAGAISGWALGVGFVVYVGWTIAHGLLLRDLPDGRSLLLVVLAAIFATDVFAYLVGKGLGRHKLAPTVSPNKTWEGAVGGLAGGVGVTIALALAVFHLPIVWWQGLVLGGSIALASEVGDLAESMLKRTSAAKSSGSLFPGHGGVLDRLDSMVFGLVVGYYVIRWLVP